MEGNQSKGGRTQGGQRAEQNENVREGFGDDMGTRVGRPDAGGADDRSMARLSENADERGIEGGVLAGSSNPDGSRGGARSTTRADGSSMEGETLDHSLRAQSGMPERESQQSGASQSGASQSGASQSGASHGAGAEANRGVEGANVKGGTDEQGGSGSGAKSGVNQGDRGQGDRAGSEPLSGRQNEHKGSYGGEGGEPRESSDKREKGLDYYGDEGTGKSR